MSAKSKYLVSKLKCIFGWNSDLICETPNNSSFMFIGISAVGPIYAANAWLYAKNDNDCYPLKIIFDHKSVSPYISIHFNDLHDEKHNAIIEAVFTQIYQMVGKGYDIVSPSYTSHNGILIEKNSVDKMLIECDLMT